MNILFVCMGNICRSPSAEGFFRMHLERAGLAGSFQVDSAGTHGYHVGHAPDERAVLEAAKYGVDIGGLRARQVREEDFLRFDHIVVMDRHNLEVLQRMRPQHSRAALSLMMEHAREPGVHEVPDPYYGAQSGFTLMCELLDDATGGLLEKLAGRPGH